MAGVGRPKGLPKTGGRQKGTKDKKIAEKEAQIAASGLTPLEYMLGIMRDANNDQPVRLDAAKSAAPYCHQKLISTQSTVNATVKIEDILRNVILRDSS
jgi:hypothetical protein